MSTPLPQDLDKKKNGIFYSPPEVTSILCKFGIRSPEDTVLEPSFGGCEFLNSSKNRLVHLNCEAPEARLFGADIDIKAFEYLARILNVSDISKRFLHRDFLSVRPEDFLVDKFDVVIGNPAYVSHHNMSEEQRKAAQSALHEGGVKLGQKPSLWAYFVLHSLAFIKESGRAAWILPSSFAHAEYAAEVRALLKQHFTRSLVIVLGERLFLSEGTEERTVVLLCEGWSEHNIDGSMEICFASDLSELSSVVENWQVTSWQGVVFSVGPMLAFMSDQAGCVYNEVLTLSEVKTLSDLAKVRIGIVTGANSFFVVNHREAEAARLPAEALSYIVAKYNELQGLHIQVDDFDKLKRNNKRCLLVNTSLVGEVTGALEEYLARFPDDARDANETFKKRKIWHRPDDGLTPDAFFPYMHHNGPCLMLNTARSTSTNTVHRIYFDASVSESVKKLVSVSLLSTFSQLSAEIEGRSYGSGVLKHEPSEVRRIQLILPTTIADQTINESFSKVDTLLRGGRLAEAQAESDRLVLTDFTESDRRNYRASLEIALSDSRLRRQRPQRTAQ